MVESLDAASKLASMLDDALSNERSLRGTVERLRSDKEHLEVRLNQALKDRDAAVVKALALKEARGA